MHSTKQKNPSRIGKPRRTAGEHLVLVPTELVGAPLYIGKMR